MMSNAYWDGYDKGMGARAIAERFQQRNGYWPNIIIYPPASTWTAEDWHWCAERGVAVVARKPAASIALAGPRRRA